MILPGLVLIVALTAFLAVLDTKLQVLRLYPVVMNLSAGGFCVYTLIYPPSAIARLSTLAGMTITGPGVIYTRRLTWVWAVFLFLNAAAAGYTALFSSLDVWALYNGLISYGLMGLLLTLEYPVRLAYQRRHGESAP